MSEPRSYEVYLGAARAALTIGIARPKGAVATVSENGSRAGEGGGGGGGDGAEVGFRGFFLYSSRRLLIPYLLLQVQRSVRWSGQGEAAAVQVIGVIEVELPAAANRQELRVAAGQWQQLGAEAERCYLAYLGA